MLIINHFLLFYKVKVLIYMDAILCFHSFFVAVCTLNKTINHIDQAVCINHILNLAIVQVNLKKVLAFVVHHFNFALVLKSLNLER